MRHSTARTFYKLILFLCIVASYAYAQTSSFTFQGKLSDGGAPANANYDMQFRLFDDLGAGDQIGATHTISDVQAIAGIFTVQLDFGAGAFSGEDRFIEISISPAGQNTFTTLAPRQKLNSVPYSVQSLNAMTADSSIDSLNLGGIPASQYVQTFDSRLSDARIPLPGSSDYVQNTGTQQPGVGFNIGGTGTANVLNAATQFSLGDVRMLAANGPYNNAGTIFAASNTFVGDDAGVNTTPAASPSSATGKFNSFFGANAGKANTTGGSNSFFGTSAGISNTTGNSNSFFGLSAGRSNSVGDDNSFFGQLAGVNNIDGMGNSFFGRLAGSGSTGSFNTFVGSSAGYPNTTGSGNTFVGASTAPFVFNQIGSFNTNIGYNANIGSSNLSNATVIGAFARVEQSNSLVLGSINGINGATASTNVGIGTTTPAVKLHITGDSEGIRIQGNAVGNANGAYLSFADGGGTPLGYVGDGSSGDNSIYVTSYIGDVNLYTPVGAALTATANGTILMRGGLAQPTSFAAQVFDNNNGPYKGILANTVFLGLNAGFDTLLASPVHVCARIESLGGGFGGYALVRCSSPFAPASNKADVRQFSAGLEIIRRLNPVSFKWKDSGAEDIGLNAEEVAEIDSPLVTRNEMGEIEDVRESSLSVVFINAIKEQQTQIDAQAARIEDQQRQIEALKVLVCAANAHAEVCREEMK